MGEVTVILCKDMPIEEYHQPPEWSRSQVMDYIESPELFRGRYVDCNIPRKSVTPAMSAGLLVDEFLTEGRQLPEVGLPNGVVMAPDDVLTSNLQRRGKNWTEFVEQHMGEVVWTQKQAKEHKAKQGEQIEMLKAIEQQVDNHEMARRFLQSDDAIFQPSLFSDDGWRCRPDLIVDNVAIVDIKFMADISAEGVAKSAYTFGYDVQGALCQIAWQSYMNDLAPLPFVLLCIHSTAPYEVATYSLTDDFLELGCTRFFEALDGIDDKQWRSKGHGQVLPLDAPPWRRKRKESAALPVEQQVY